MSVANSWSGDRKIPILADGDFNPAHGHSWKEWPPEGSGNRPQAFIIAQMFGIVKGQIPAPPKGAGICLEREDLLCRNFHRFCNHFFLVLLPDCFCNSSGGKFMGNDLDKLLFNFNGAAF